MKIIKSRVFWVLSFLAFGGLVVLAQATNTNVVPVTPGPVPDIPQTVSQFWDLAIAAISPIVIWGVTKAVPKIPKVLLPSMTPLVGIGLGVALNKLAGANLGWLDMAKAGALAVFVREVVNQAITKTITGGDTPPAPSAS